jgi:hypothetical protein
MSVRPPTDGNPGPDLVSRLSTRSGRHCQPVITMCLVGAVVDPGSRGSAPVRAPHLAGRPRWTFRFRRLCPAGTQEVFRVVMDGH